MAGTTALWPRLWQRCVVVHLDADRASDIKNVRVYCNGVCYLVCVESGGGGDNGLAYVVPYDKSCLYTTHTFPLENLRRSSTGVDVVTMSFAAVSKDVEPHLCGVNDKSESDKAHITSASSSVIAFTDADGNEIKINVR